MLCKYDTFINGEYKIKYVQCIQHPHVKVRDIVPTDTPEPTATDYYYPTETEYFEPTPEGTIEPYPPIEETPNPYPLGDWKYQW